MIFVTIQIYSHLLALTLNELMTCYVNSFMKGISSSDLELVHLLQTLGCGDIRKSLSHGYARLLNAFGLLQREPIIMVNLF